MTYSSAIRAALICLSTGVLPATASAIQIIAPVQDSYPDNPYTLGLKPRGADSSVSTSLVLSPLNPLRFVFETGIGANQIKYVVDFNTGTPMSRGVLEIDEATTGIRPVAQAGPRYRPSTAEYLEYGKVVEPINLDAWGDTTIQGSPIANAAERSVTVNYEHDMNLQGESKFLTSQLKITLVGRSLKVKWHDTTGATDPDYRSNFAGFTTGRMERVTNAHDMKIPFMTGFPVQRVTGPKPYKKTFTSTWIDLSQSNGQARDHRYYVNYAGFKADPSNATVTASRITRYDPNSTDFDPAVSPWIPRKMNGTLDETMWVTVSKELEDTFIRTEANPSPYRDILSSKVQAVGFFNRPSVTDPTATRRTWSEYEEVADDWESYGMDLMSIYYFTLWNNEQVNFAAAAPCPGTLTVSTGSPAPCTQKPLDQWNNAHDPIGFRQHFRSEEQRGVITGVYTGYDREQFSTHTPAQYFTEAFLNDGPNNNINNVRTELSYLGARLNSTVEDEQLYLSNGLSSIFVDILGPKYPDHFIDHNHSGRNAKTMRDNQASRRQMFAERREAVSGPLVSEGSGYFPGHDGAIYNAGWVDALDGILNTGGFVLPSESSSPNEKLSRYNWWVMPEYTLREMNPVMLKNGNGFMVRFECHDTAYDRPTGALTPATGGYYNAIGSGLGDPIDRPLEEPLLDKYRAYEITNGTRAHIETFGDTNDQGHKDADRVKEYYMMQALQTDYLRSNVSTVEYWNGTQFQTAGEILLASNAPAYDVANGQYGIMEELTHPQLRLEYDSGLVVYVNHSPTSWSVTVNVVGGTESFVIPEDGFVASNPHPTPSKSLLAFSAIPSALASRIDYVDAPLRYRFFDGRGVVTNYLGLQNTTGNLFVENFIRNLAVEEDGNDALTPTQGSAPMLDSLQLVGPTTLPIGNRGLVRVMATYVDSSTGVVVAKSEVSHLKCTFTSNDASRVSIDRTGIVTGLDNGLVSVEVNHLGKTKLIYITVP